MSFVPLVDLALDQADQVAHGGDGGSLRLPQLLNAEFLLQGHGEIHDVHGIRVQVVLKGGVHGDGVGVHVELLGDQCTQLFKNDVSSPINACDLIGTDISQLSNYKS